MGWNSLRIGLRLTRAIFIASLLPACMVMAAPPPLMTVGGPATAPAGGAEVALGAGSGGSLFPGAHGTGHGWLGRYRYGLSERTDLGVDLLNVQHGGTGALTGKLALRYRLRPHWRIEGGMGAADDSNGKSANADLGLTVGSLRPERWWDYYGSMRMSAAHGIVSSAGNGVRVPPDDAIFIGSAGASIRIQPNIHFVIEGGYGAIEIRGVSNVGQAIYLGTFILMTTGH